MVLQIFVSMSGPGVLRDKHSGFSPGWIIKLGDVDLSIIRAVPTGSTEVLVNRSFLVT